MVELPGTERAHDHQLNDVIGTVRVVDDLLTVHHSTAWLLERFL